jgi:hypothetical protein
MQLVHLERPAKPSRLADDLLRFTKTVDGRNTPEAVLDALDEITWLSCHTHVLGAELMPMNFGTTDSLVIDKTVFLHKSVPKGWWEERMELSAKSPAPGAVAARLALAPFTTSELMRSLEPIGIDRWATELNLKHGMRDFFGCPIGGRWIFAYWSPKLMHLEGATRAALSRGRICDHQIAKTCSALHGPPQKGC